MRAPQLWPQSLFFLLIFKNVKTIINLVINLVDFLDKKKQQAVAHPVYFNKIHYTTLLHYFTTLHNYRIHTRHPTLSCMDTSCFFRTVLVNTLLSQLSHQFVMFGWYVFIDNGLSVNFIITMVTYTSHA